MANPDHLKIARSGHKEWNKWRQMHRLERADFSGVDFTLGENRRISFVEFEFGDDAQFEGATFGDDASFVGTKFGNEAGFVGATFGRGARFDRATFRDLADFEGATFEHNAGFVGATFGDEAGFVSATFGRGARFDGATFGDRAEFEGATFGYNARFKGAAFGDEAGFVSATFGRGARFDGATFGDGAEFEGATFKGTVSFQALRQRSEPTNRAEPPQASTRTEADEPTIGFDVPEVGTHFRSIRFSRARFLGTAYFADRDFRGEANFSNVIFDQPPDFRSTEQRENLDWTSVRFGFGWYPELGPFRLPLPRRTAGSRTLTRLRQLEMGPYRLPLRGWTTQGETITRLRRLRGIAKEIHAVDAERDLFILERQAERGILWRDWWRGGWQTRFSGWWRPLTRTLLMFLYLYSSDCGRGAFLPFVWLVASNVGFYFLHEFMIKGELSFYFDQTLFDLTFASAIPFGAPARAAYQSALEEFFYNNASGAMEIPWEIQVTSAVQGILNLVFLFLLGLALRNYFKFRT